MFYSLIASLFCPAAWWGRLRVEGLEHVPETGPLLVVPNHDSQWDPILVGLAIRPRRRLRFLGRDSLWRIPGLAPILNGLRQIPVRRGAGDAAALERVVALLRSGEAVGIFPEGGLSWGEPRRARSGVGLGSVVPHRASCSARWRARPTTCVFRADHASRSASSRQLAAIRDPVKSQSLVRPACSPNFGSGFPRRRPVVARSSEVHPESDEPWTGNR